jgi:IS30 family transposase
MAKQLTLSQRYHIAVLLSEAKMQKDIAEKICTSRSTLTRELQRNGGRENYDPDQAHQRAIKLRQTAPKAIKMSFAVIQWIESKIRIEWRPEQIAAKTHEALGVSISHERIYQHIWQDKRRGGTLYKHLPQSGKRRKKYGSKDKRGQIVNRVSIDERPNVVAEKSRIGDWEIDTVIGKNHQGALVTIVERVSKFTLVAKVLNKQSDTVTEATIALLKPYRGNKLFTITADNGKEFAGHEKIAQELDLKVYFAHPYSSWERGVNENTNGLIRQYFPKGSSFEDITDADVEKVMERLNHRPRKTLNYKTPFEVFFENSQRKAA